MSDFFVEFLTRPGCHLCEDAEAVIRRVARRVRASVVTTNIDSDPVMAVDWDLRIPVVLGPDGVVLGEGPIEEWRLFRTVLGARLRRLVPRLSL